MNSLKDISLRLWAKDAAATEENNGQHWVTIRTGGGGGKPGKPSGKPGGKPSGKPGGEKPGGGGYRRLLLDGNGRIIGGDVPAGQQGKPIRQAFRDLSEMSRQEKVNELRAGMQNISLTRGQSSQAEAESYAERTLSEGASFFNPDRIETLREIDKGRLADLAQRLFPLPDVSGPPDIISEVQSLPTEPVPVAAALSAIEQRVAEKPEKAGKVKSEKIPPISKDVIKNSTVSDGFMERAKRFFPSVSSVEEVMKIAGIFNSACSKFSFRNDFDVLIIKNISNETDKVETMTRIIRPNGTMHMDYFRVNESFHGQKLGTKMLVQAVAAAQKAGLKKIDTHAAGEGDGTLNDKQGEFNGYYTWIRMGYEQPISEHMMRRIQERKDYYVSRGFKNYWKPEFDSYKKVSDFMTTEDGVKAWKAYGGGTDHAYIDLSPGSEQVEHLKAYAKAKGIKWPK